MEQGAKDSNWETFKVEKEKGAFESTQNWRSEEIRHKIKELGLLLMRPTTPAISIYHNAVINKFLSSNNRTCFSLLFLVWSFYYRRICTQIYEDK